VLQPEKGDPFPPKSTRVVAEILDVKDGWVRYKILESTSKDERMDIETFTAIYSLLDT